MHRDTKQLSINCAASKLRVLLSLVSLWFDAKIEMEEDDITVGNDIRHENKVLDMPKVND